MTPLEERERVGTTSIRMLLYIIDFYALHGRGPQYNEIMTHLMINRSSTAYHLRRLRDLGLIEWKVEHMGTLRPKVAVTSVYR